MVHRMQHDAAAQLHTSAHTAAARTLTEPANNAPHIYPISRTFFPAALGTLDIRVLDTSLPETPQPRPGLRGAARAGGRESGIERVSGCASSVFAGLASYVLSGLRRHSSANISCPVALECP